MNMHNLRYSVGLLVLVGHFIAAAVFVWHVNERDTSDIWDYLGGLTAIVPFTLLYASVFYKYVVANPTGSQAARDQPIDVAPFFIQVVMVAAFVVCLIGSIFWAFNDLSKIEGVENMSVVLGGIDTLFAVFVSSTFSSLFPMEWEASKKEASEKTERQVDPTDSTKSTNKNPLKDEN